MDMQKEFGKSVVAFIGLTINEGWVGRTTEVLVERIETPRSHDHGDAPAPVARVSGRNREHKLHIVCPSGTRRFTTEYVSWTSMRNGMPRDPR